MEREALQNNQRVSDMASEVLARQAKSRTARTGEVLEEALKVIVETEAGQQLVELRDGLYRDELAGHWQEDLARKRYDERRQARQEKRRRARQEECRQAQLAAWKAFMETELQELELRKDGQLARLLGEPQPGEAPEALQRLATEDRRQAEEGLVALMSNGQVFYKCLKELSEEDMSAREAANRVRATWLKVRLDGWLGLGEDLP